jgi:diguanylate cyclase (GGDEF)-like protein
MSGPTANDDFVVTLAEAKALVGEIKRLQLKVTALEHQVGELEAIAHLDPLVGLPNRRAFLGSLENLIRRTERYGDPAAIIFLDVDGLKAINDTFGHEAGDAALDRIAKLIVSSVRSSDCVARIGGDEFAVLLERADELGAWNMALRVVETVVGSEFCIADCRLPLSVAAGVGVIRPGDTPASVMRRADEAMYQFKPGAKNRLRRPAPLPAE